MRSAWKGLYQHIKLLKGLINEDVNDNKIYSRASWLNSELVGESYQVHNGKSFAEVTVSPLHTTHRLGEFARTRAFFVPKVKKKKQKAKPKAKKKVQTKAKKRKK